ncbi:MAG: DUF4489 domain-containing protein [Tepidibacter sp.]|jgi:hypothetical protein|uniref:DUF4489 domain-containing protein n=1 Tax=Tepidibacter sp. TaxID=2529387 RepID=UPI0025E74235|nr:DUF4489 domain-containing protein [Tepidibacter sp.]MCT4508379.1 DUF4489 domain-containing protein [Tepidibacter sp.]
MSTYYKKDTCDKKKKKDCNLTLKCGEIFDPDLPPIFDADPNNPIMQPIKLASVTIDTQSLRKQCVVSIEYSSIINLVGVGESDNEGESITLNFRLIKEFKNKKTEILQEWEYTESNIEEQIANEKRSKESFTVTFCECLDYLDSDFCTYTMQLVRATPFLDVNNDTPTILYSITNKNILAISSCNNSLQCGKSFNRSLPPILDDSNNPNMSPVKLACVAVDTRALRNACVNIKYSSIINLLANNAPGDDSSPNVSILLRFRLIRECKNKKTKVLQEWEYMESDIEDNIGEREYKDSFTINFCECLDCLDSDCCIYTIQLVKANPSLLDDGSVGVLYNINNKNISAVISSENHIQCGKEFNRSLPPRLNDDPDNSTMPPVKLACVKVDTRSLCNPCVNIEYSSIINAIAAVVSSSPNVDIELRFRLIRECKNKETEILQEWEYIESNHEDTDNERESKESFTITFCECLGCLDSDCCTYTMELIKAAPSILDDGSLGMLYNITNKNISAIVTCKPH